MTNQTTNTTNNETNEANEAMQNFSKSMVSFNRRKENADKAQAKFFKDNFATALTFQDYVQAKNELCLKKDDNGNFKLSKKGKVLVDNTKLEKMLTDTPFGNATWILQRAFRNEKGVILNTTCEETKQNMANNPDCNATGWHGLEQAEKARKQKIANALKKEQEKNNPTNDADNADNDLSDDEAENAPLAIRQTIGKITADKDYQNLNSAQISAHMKDMLKALLKDNRISKSSFDAYRTELKTGTNN